MRGAHLVSTGPAGDGFALHIDDKDISTITAHQGIGTGTAIQRVITRAASNGLAAGRTCAYKIARTDEGEFFNAAGRGYGVIVQRGANLVGRAAAIRHRISQIVDHIHVIAAAAAHRIASGTAIQRVVAVVAGQGVVQRVAAQGNAGGGIDRTFFDAGCQRVASHRDLDFITTAAVGHTVAEIVDVIEIIPCTAGERICPRHAIEGVVARTTGQHVADVAAGEVDRTSAGEFEVLDVRRQGVGGQAGAHGVRAFIAGFDHDVIDVVDQIEIVIGTADQRVIA